MISNPRLLFYSCIAKGTVLLAEFSSKEEPGIEDLALRCIENIPPHHSMFSHTVRKRTYAFVIDGSFSYFAILDEVMEKSESLWLLTRLRSAMEALMAAGSAKESLANPTPHCLQSKLDPVFAEIGGGNMNLEPEVDLNLVARKSWNQSEDSSGGRKEKPVAVNLLKNKKRLNTEAKSEDCGGEEHNTVLSKGIRNGLLQEHQKQKAKLTWRKHVCVVLMFDACICAVLFGIWLWICKGFQCIER